MCLNTNRDYKHRSLNQTNLSKQIKNLIIFHFLINYFQSSVIKTQITDYLHNQYFSWIFIWLSIQTNSSLLLLPNLPLLLLPRSDFDCWKRDGEGVAVEREEAVVEREEEMILDVWWEYLYLGKDILVILANMMKTYRIRIISDSFFHYPGPTPIAYWTWNLNLIRIWNPNFSDNIRYFGYECGSGTDFWIFIDNPSMEDVEDDEAALIINDIIGLVGETVLPSQCEF